MLESLIVFILISLLSLLGYVVKRGLDMVQFLIGMPKESSIQSVRPAFLAKHEKEEDKEKIFDEYYTESESVVAEHVLDRHREAQAKADQIREELNAMMQDPRAGIYPVDHASIDSTFIPRPKEEYAQ